MRRLVWAFGWVGVAFWSVFCAAAYFLFDVVGRLFMSNADVFASNPETVEGLWKFFSVVRSFSTGGVMVVWAIVSLLILAVPWTLDRLAGRVRVVQVPAPMPGGGGFAPGAGFRPEPQMRGDVRGDVIDLPADQYTVGPRSGPQGGEPPRLPPRA